MTMTATRERVHRMDLDVNIFDTDCFGVMWHGAYTKWMEMGRVKLFEERGLTLSRPDEPNGYIYPVVEQNLRYKNPAPYQDKLTLTTRLTIDGYKLVFAQTFQSKNSGKVTLEALTTVVVLDSNWKLQRKIPGFILASLDEA
jgi:acyl-CoA thioester hydrolase